MEEYYRRVLTETSELAGLSAQGAWGRIIANAYANRIALGGRFNWLDPSSRLSNDRVLQAEGQVAWYILAPSLVLRLRYAWQEQRSPDPAALGKVRLPFAPGTTHLITLQLTLAF